MNLNIFNPWRDLVTWSGHILQYQTSKKANSFITTIRDKESNKPITYGLSRTSKEDAFSRAESNLKAIGINGVEKAIATGQIIMPSTTDSNQPNIDWRDGIGHSYRAQREIVDKNKSI